MMTFGAKDADEILRELVEELIRHFGELTPLAQASIKELSLRPDPLPDNACESFVMPEGSTYQELGDRLPQLTDQQREVSSHCYSTHALYERLKQAKDIAMVDRAELLCEQFDGLLRAAYLSSLQVASQGDRPT